MKLVMRLIILSGLLIALALGGLRLAAHLRERESRDDLLPSDGRLVATSEGRIFVTERGTIGDPSVLLIHGSVGWSAMWLPTLEALADAGYRAIALDLPPMGYSDVPPDGAYDREAQARRILALMAALEIRPHLVAHSFGAGPASEAVMSAPDRVTSLVIVDGALPLDPGHEAQLPSVLRPLWVREVVVAATVLNPLAGRSLVRLFLHRKEAASDALMDLLWQPATREGATEVLAAWLPSLLIPDRNARSVQSASFAALDLPVALIWGAEDTTTPLSDGERLRDLIPGARLTVLPDTGHIPQIEDPEAFNAALIESLADL